MVEEEHHMTCSGGHTAQNSLVQRFNLSLKGNITSSDPPLSRDNLTPIAKSETQNTMEPPCTFCNSADSYVKDAHYLRKPELLIITCPFRAIDGAMTWEQFSYRVSLEEEICLPFSDRERYVLVGATLVTGDSWGSSAGHVMAAVRAPNGNITIINDDDVWQRGPRWSSVEGLQTRADRTEVLLPHLLIYRRKYEAPPALPTYPRGSIASDPSVEKAVLAMKLALPHIAPEDLLWEYYRADESIQRTIDHFLTGHDMQKEVTLDDVMPGYLEDVVKVYVRYPQLGVKKIYELIQTNRGSFDFAIKKIDDLAGLRVNYSFQEFVGSKGFNVDLDVVDETFVDGYAEVVCKKTKTVKTARLFGVLIEPEPRVHTPPPNSPASSPRRAASRSASRLASQSRTKFQDQVALF